MTVGSPSLVQDILAKEGDLRLNLGGRDKPISGFVTVDLFDGKGVDVKSDCSDLSFAKDGTVSEIYASHILEHWPHTKTLFVLEEWRRVLKPKGLLYISVPDLDAVLRLIQKYGFQDYCRNLLYGDQEYDLAFHYTIFTFPILAALCVKAGFSDVQKIDQMPYGLRDCSKNVDNYTFKPISVNVKAIA